MRGCYFTDLLVAVIAATERMRLHLVFIFSRMYSVFLSHCGPQLKGNLRLDALLALHRRESSMRFSTAPPRVTVAVVPGRASRSELKAFRVNPEIFQMISVEGFARWIAKLSS